VYCFELCASFAPAGDGAPAYVNATEGQARGGHEAPAYISATEGQARGGHEVSAHFDARERSPECMVSMGGGSDPIASPSRKS
jgi:hypothetical protein